MQQHVQEGLTEEQLSVYREIQNVLSSIRTANHEDLRRLMNIIEDLTQQLQASRAQQIPDGYEIRWGITDDILATSEPHLVKVVDIDERYQGVLPLHQVDTEDAA